MKILFTADWHIKLGQKNVPTQWQINRYNLLVDKLNDQEADLLIIGGDIFDRIPTLDELKLYCELLSKFNKKTLIYPGNHEALGKNTTFLSKLKDISTAINPAVEISIIDNYWNWENFSILPYNLLKDFAKDPKQYDNVTTKILFTHVRGEIPPHVTPEIDLELFSKWDVVFAGDLHSYTNSQRNIVYPGSPLTITFHRNEVDTGYLLIDTKALEYSWIKLDLPQLIRRTISDPSLMIPSKFNHTIYELEGDITDLAKVSGHELLDKKIVSTTSESQLALHKDMSIEEELKIFLTDILKLKAEDIVEILHTYHAYTT